MRQAITIQTVFNLSVVIFTLGNLAAMGLEVEVPVVIAASRSNGFVVLSTVRGWVTGPAFTYLLTMVIPLAEPYETISFRINLKLDPPEANVKIVRPMLWTQLS